MRVFSIFFFLIGCGVQNFSFGQKKIQKVNDSIYFLRANYSFPYDSLAENFIFFNPKQTEFNNYLNKKSYRKFLSDKGTYACGDFYKLDSLTLRLIENATIGSGLKLKYAKSYIDKNHKISVDSLGNDVLRHFFGQFDSLAKDVKFLLEFYNLGENLILFNKALIKLKQIKVNEENYIGLVYTGSNKLQALDKELFRYSKALTDSFINFILPSSHRGNPTMDYTYFFNCNYLGITDSSFRNKRIPVFSSNEAFLEIEIHDVSYDTLHYLRLLQYYDYMGADKDSKMSLKMVLDSMQKNPAYFDSIYAQYLNGKGRNYTPYFFETENCFQNSLKSKYKINKFLRKGEFAASKNGEEIDYIIKATKDSEVVPYKARISFYYYEKIKPTKSVNKTNPIKR